MIDTFTFTKEEFGETVRVVCGIDVLGDFTVNSVVSDGDVDRALFFELNDELLEVKDVLA